MKLASIQNITDIRPIASADRIEAPTVLGYQTVIKKGEFQPGDLCVWHEPDTVVAEKPEYEFLRKQGLRLKVSHFKGQVSQGLALPLRAIPSAAHAVGDDVTELTGIRKYEKPLAANLVGVAKGAFPSWIPKTDEPNLRSFPAALAEFIGRECVITQKVDGTSATYYLRGGEFGVCTRNLELLEDSASMFWRIAQEHRLREALATLGGDFALQGEVHGEGVQGNDLTVKGKTFAATDLCRVQPVRHCGTCIRWPRHALGILPIQQSSHGSRSLARRVPVHAPGTGRVVERAGLRGGTSGRGHRDSSSGGGALSRAGEWAMSAKVISERYALKHGE